MNYTLHRLLDADIYGRLHFVNYTLKMKVEVLWNMAFFAVIS